VTPLVREVRVPRGLVHWCLYAVAVDAGLLAVGFAAAGEWRRACLLVAGCWLVTALGTVAHRRARALAQQHVPDWDAVLVTHADAVERLPAGMRNEFRAREEAPGPRDGQGTARAGGG
jgi:hypothetical protein